MNESPAFQLYAREWIADVGLRILDDAAKAVFWDLVLYCWSEGGLPTDRAILARLVGRDPEEFERIWTALSPRFQTVEIGGREVLFESRLYDVYTKQKAKREETSEKRRSAVNTRWERERQRRFVSEKDGKNSATKRAERSTRKGSDTKNTSVSLAGGRAADATAEANAVEEEVEAFESDKVSPPAPGGRTVAMQPTFDDPNPQPTPSSARRLGRLMAEIRMRGAGMTRLDPKAVVAYARLFAKLLNSGHTPQFLEIMLRWCEATEEGQKFWGWNMDSLPRRGKTHPLETHVGTMVRLARAWSAESAGGDLSGAAGANVIVMGGGVEATHTAVELETWWHRAREQWRELADSPEVFESLINPLSLSGTHVRPDGTLVACITARTEEAYSKAREKTWVIQDVLRNTAPGSRPAKFTVEYDLPEGAEESEASQ